MIACVAWFVVSVRQPVSLMNGRWWMISASTCSIPGNHDEQRIASDFFCGNAMKAIPAAAMSLFFQKNPFMLYSGQEFGEKGMDKEGFSGRDGRTTIFDYWSPSTLAHAYQDSADETLTAEQKYLAATYRQLLRLANEERRFEKVILST